MTRSSTASPTTTSAPPSSSTSWARSTDLPERPHRSGRCTGSSRRPPAPTRPRSPVVAERLYSEGLRLLGGQHGAAAPRLPHGPRPSAGRAARDRAGARRRPRGRRGEPAGRRRTRSATSAARCWCSPTSSRRRRAGRHRRTRSTRPAGCSRRSAMRRARPRCCASAASAPSPATSTPPPPSSSSRRWRATRSSTTGAAWPGSARTWRGAPSTPAGRRRPRCCCTRPPPPSRRSATRAGCGWARGLLAWARFQQGHSAEAGEMAEAILTDDRRVGDRWAIGMMLILAGSVRLWTGRTLSAIDRLREARALFDEIHDDFGHSQSSAVLGRALVLAGQVDEGLEMVASMGREDGTPLSEREFIVSIMAGLAATVQVGDLERSEQMLTIIPAGPVDGDDGELIVGDTERTASVGLHRLQSGDVAGAVAVLRLAGGTAAARRSTRTCTPPSRWRTWPTARSTRRWPEADAGGCPRPGHLPRPAHRRHRPRPGAVTPGRRGRVRPPPSIRCGRPPTPPRTASRRRSSAWPMPPPRPPAATPTPRPASPTRSGAWRSSGSATRAGARRSPSPSASLP